MTDRTVETHGELSVGQRVLLIEESGFDAGKPQSKVIAEIRIIEWTPEEAKKLRNPRQERFIEFTDGSTASHYDRVRPDRSQL